METKQLGFLGAGNMAMALIQGVLKKHPAARVHASDPSAERRQLVVHQLDLPVSSDNTSTVTNSDVVVLATKPSVAASVLSDVKDVWKGEKLLVSVCAGVTCAQLESCLPSGARVIRAMPNTPALIGAGATAFARGKQASPEDAEYAMKLFQCVGECVEVEERLLDAVTGLSGSGPAYVLMAIEALADGGVRVGLPRPIALKLALQTVVGTARLAQETGEHPAVLKDRVTSPGGTTMSGVEALERAGFRHALMDAVSAATRRSEELGRK